jgi:DNA-binding response OmpR family regulator
MMSVSDEQTEQLSPKPKSIRVLIADDDPPTRMLLRAAISQWGYDPIEVGDGEKAWEILQQPDPPRLLILDWLMPQLDGIVLCERIKTTLPYHPYIILLTQVVGTANIVKGLEAGADEFLSKPFNMAELRSRLSVGARIIGYENKLAAQNAELQKYINQTQTAQAPDDHNIEFMLTELVERHGGLIEKDNANRGSVRYIIDLPLPDNGD